MKAATAAARPVSHAGSLSGFWVVALVFAAALVERAFFDTTSDVSWLITLSEKMLSGARPYVDFIEVNPPASIFIYLPAVVFGRAAGITPEFSVALFVFMGAAASLWIAARILLGAGILREADLWPLVSLFTAILLVLPASTFAQREHVALIALLPMLAVSAARATNKPVPLHWAIVAGIGAGITAIIKPYFVFPVLFSAGAAALSARSLRPIFAIENWISAALLALYVAVVAIAYPEFVSDILPAVMAVYVSQKANLSDLLTLGTIPFWCGAFLVILALKRKETFAAPFVVLLAASFGFLVAFAVQQKGVAYHAYPALSLILATAAITLSEKSNRNLVRFGGAAVIAGIVGATFSWFAAAPDLHALVAPIRAASPHPKILNISGGGAAGMGFPIARQVGGIWVGRTCGQWVSSGAMVAKINGADAKTAAMLDRYIERDRKLLAEDIVKNKPDIILADRIRYDWLKWAEADPVLARELRNYRPLAEANGILALRRN